MQVGVHAGIGLGPSLYTPYMTYTHRCPTLTHQSGYAKIGSVVACSIALAVEKLYSTYIIDTVYRLHSIVILLRALAIIAHDVVDPNLILNEPCKQKLASYATNKDNCSAHKSETIKRMKKMVGLTDSLLSLIKANDPHLDTTLYELEGAGYYGSKSLKPYVTNRGATCIAKSSNSKPTLKPKNAAPPSLEDSAHISDKNTNRDSSHIEEIELEDSDNNVEEVLEAAEKDPKHELSK